MRVLARPFPAQPPCRTSWPARTACAALALLVTLAISPATSHAYDYFPIEDPFWWTWARSDFPVSNGDAPRTWMWGPGGFTNGGWEPYSDSPGGERYVQYFDKSRMEINDPNGDPNSPWYVTNGRLAWELMTGNIQVGDDEYLPYIPAEIPVAGDPDPETPTYAGFGLAMGWALQEVGDPVNHVLVRDILDIFGEEYFSVEDDEMETYGVWAEHYVPETDFVVASVFWEFMNSSGTIYDQNGYQQGPLFQNPYYATGYPLTDALWLDFVPVGGVEQDVLVQCFERRCLSYTPNNPPGWQVEAGNIGQHNFEWRYGE